MRETEFWRRLTGLAAVTNPRLWADTAVLSSLDGRTPVEALRDGVACVKVWRCVCDYLEVPASLR